MDKLRLPEDQPIQNGLVTRSIEQSQVKVEGFHFDQRKRLVEYDDVANQQREIVYKLRGRILSGENVKEVYTPYNYTHLALVKFIKDNSNIIKKDKDNKLKIKII